MSKNTIEKPKKNEKSENNQQQSFINWLFLSRHNQPAPNNLYDMFFDYYVIALELLTLLLIFDDFCWFSGTEI